MSGEAAELCEAAGARHSLGLWSGRKRRCSGPATQGFDATARQVSSMSAPRRRKALPITEAELRLMASAANMGDSSHPVKG